MHFDLSVTEPILSATISDKSKMAGGLLLQSQRNDVFQEAQRVGVDPRIFDWSQEESRFSRAPVSVLFHEASGFYFKFDQTEEGHYCKYSPGTQTTTEEGSPGSWTGQMGYVTRWLNNLKREIDAPDLWGTLAGGSPLSEVAALAKDSANTSFSEAELKRVEASLAEIRKAVMASQSLTVEKLDRIDANLEYLKESAERLGRKDWLNVAVSVVINIITTAAVPPDTARHILTVAGTVLNWVLGGSPLLPHPLQ